MSSVRKTVSTEGVLSENFMFKWNTEGINVLLIIKNNFFFWKITGI